MKPKTSLLGGLTGIQLLGYFAIVAAVIAAAFALFYIRTRRKQAMASNSSPNLVSRPTMLVNDFRPINSPSVMRYNTTV